MLGASGVKSLCAVSSVEEFLERLNTSESCPCNVAIVLVSGMPFSVCCQFREVLSRPLQAKAVSPALIIVSEEVDREQVYSALWAGIKAFVYLDDEPQELLVAIDNVLCDRSYMSPSAARVLASDIPPPAKGSGRGRQPTNSGLTRREQQIVQMLCSGLTSKEIGKDLHISPKTVENHRYNIYRKLGINNIASVMRYAAKHGLITL